MRTSFQAAATGLCLSATAFVLTLTAAPAGHAQQQPAPAPTSVPAVVPAPPAEAQAAYLARAAARLTAASRLQPADWFSSADTTALVRLDLRDVTIREAARQLAEQTKREIVVDADVLESARVSLNAANLQLGTALDVLSQAAGVRWGREIRSGEKGAVVYRIGKNAPSLNVSGANTFRLRNNGQEITGLTIRSGTTFQVPPAAAAAQLRALENGLVYSYGSREERSTFTCPHCKRQATVIRKVETPKCPKCERAFQPSWQFCPYDGARRPATETTWKACPFCGKQVSQSDTTTDAPHLFDTASPAALLGVG